jgi:hypothetical protein
MGAMKVDSGGQRQGWRAAMGDIVKQTGSGPFPVDCFESAIADIYGSECCFESIFEWLLSLAGRMQAFARLEEATLSRHLAEVAEEASGEARSVASANLATGRYQAPRASPPQPG